MRCSLFLFFISSLFFLNGNSSFQDLSENLPRDFSQSLKEDIVSSVETTHQELYTNQRKLTLALELEGKKSHLTLSKTSSASVALSPARTQLSTEGSEAAQAASAQTASCASPPKSFAGQTKKNSPKESPSSVKSSKSTNNLANNLSTANFANATMLIVKKTGKIEKMDVVPPSFSAKADENPFFKIYDSCFDRSHQILPPIEDCEKQWRDYLPKKHPFFTSMETNKGELDVLKKNFSNRINSLLGQGENSTFLDLKRDVVNYYGRLQSWVHSGWHSEQRIIYDLDRYLFEILNKLRLYQQEDSPVQGMIICLHTKKSPCTCIPEKENKKETVTCDCLTTLQNWSRETLLALPGVPLFMTVSYEDVFLPNDDYYMQQLEEKNSKNFFMRQIPTQDINLSETDIPAVQKWTSEGIVLSQLNRFRGLDLPLEAIFYESIGSKINKLDISYLNPKNPLEPRLFKIVKENVELVRDQEHIKFTSYTKESRMATKTSFFEVTGMTIHGRPILNFMKVKADEDIDLFWGLAFLTPQIQEEYDIDDE